MVQNYNKNQIVMRFCVLIIINQTYFVPTFRKKVDEKVGEKRFEAHCKCKVWTRNIKKTAESDGCIGKSLYLCSKIV